VSYTNDPASESSAPFTKDVLTSDEYREVPLAKAPRRFPWKLFVPLATDKKGPLSECMLFFSLMHLRTTVQGLRRLGVKVAPCKISA
jgi:hypothetical protein